MFDIELSCDCEDGLEFVRWLNARGHNAAIGRSTGNYVNGYCTSTSDWARGILNSLWVKYCGEY